MAAAYPAAEKSGCFTENPLKKTTPDAGTFDFDQIFDTDLFFNLPN